jgi:hypothetical protein
MLHPLIASLGLATCLALAVHMALPRTARARVDTALQRLGGWLQAQAERLTGWRRRQRLARAATLEATRAINRAREQARADAPPGQPGEWQGNVFRPTRFTDKPKKPLH